MRRRLTLSLLPAVWPLLFGQASAPSSASAPAPVPTQPLRLPAASAVVGGTIHGSVKSGTIPLPGVSITATNTLTGKKDSTATSATGVYSMAIPQNGRYVVRAELAAFAASTQEALLNATGHDRQVDFTLLLASRAEQQEQREEQTQAGAGTQTRQYSGRGAQSLSLNGAAADLIAAASGGDAGGGAQLPSLAGNTDFSNESVRGSGHTGYTSP